MGKEIIQDAITILEDLASSSRSGDWKVEAVGGGSWAINGTNGDLIAEELIYGAEADLIVAMRNTVEPTINLLKLALETTGFNPFFQSALAIAESIVNSRA